MTPNDDQLKPISDVELQTPLGRLLGARLGCGSVVRFMGVRYAQPPVGEHRWRPPQPASAWKGVVAAQAPGPAAWQPLLSEEAFYADNPASRDEDCLTLNIWAPAEAQNAPVMVWIHGGNLVFGAGSNRRYDGAALARLGVVVVTLNYRLGVLGYFSHPELTLESKDGASGNYGTLDQIEALRWISQNISAFGGDSANVTVFGQSAGGLSVTHLMSSPLARDLFHRAIAMSAYLPAIPNLSTSTLGVPSAEATGKAFADRLGAASLSDLRAVKPETLLAEAAVSGFVTEAVVDGYVQPRQIFETFALGAEAPVPMIVGFTSDETRSLGGQGFLPTAPATADAYEALVEALYGDLAPRYLELYPRETPHQSMHAAARDGFYGRAAVWLATRHAANGYPAFLYLFQHTYDTAASLGAFHSSDVPFVFGNVGAGAVAPRNWPHPPGSTTDIRMSQALMTYWTNFARQGRPDDPTHARWPQVSGPQRPFMRFKAGEAIPSSDSLPEMFALVEDIIASHRRRGLAWWRWENISLCREGVNAPDRPAS